MKRIGMISTAVLSLALGVAAPVFAQEQHDQQDEQKAKAGQEEKKPQPEKSAKPEQKNTKPEEKNAQQDKNNRNVEKPAEQQRAQQPQPGKQEQRAGNNRGGRIPDDRFKANFGEQHRFHVSQADYSRDHRFQYGGYWFAVENPWPSNWLYTQDVYVMEINGVYYLCNPMYPGVNVLLSVTL
jgi:hypothetical protein